MRLKVTMARMKTRRRMKTMETRMTVNEMVEFTTANGRRIKVSPAHIVCIAKDGRGTIWIRLADGREPITVFGVTGQWVWEALQSRDLNNKETAEVAA
jgi:hypothetical protein